MTAAGPLTEARVVLGTAAYMSPEQAQGQKLDARSDIFSFGAVLYEMATGKRAFSAGSSIAILGRIIHEDPKPPSEIAGSVPPADAMPIGCRFSTRCPFVVEKCRRERPPMKMMPGGHGVACFRAPLELNVREQPR